MGFANLITFDDKDISTQYTALMSKVMTNGNGQKFPINEPAQGLKKSQIEEYLDFYGGAGCQHIAVATDDIVFTISEMRKSWVEFLHVPGTYYDTVGKRVGDIAEDLETLKSLSIMVDRDDEGYLLQIFTNLWKIGRPYFLKSSNEKELNHLVKAIFKHYSRVLRLNKQSEGHFNTKVNTPHK